MAEVDKKIQLRKCQLQDLAALIISDNMGK